MPGHQHPPAQRSYSPPHLRNGRGLWRYPGWFQRHASVSPSPPGKGHSLPAEQSLHQMTPLFELKVYSRTEQCSSPPSHAPVESPSILQLHSESSRSRRREDPQPSESGASSCLLTLLDDIPDQEPSHAVYLLFR